MRGADFIDGIFGFDRDQFPSLPRSIDNDALLEFSIDSSMFPLSTQRNFWVYLFLECDNETYRRFVGIHSEVERERVSPTC